MNVTIKRAVLANGLQVKEVLPNGLFELCRQTTNLDRGVLLLSVKRVQ